ncbi:MAG: hypothetical protein E5Y63_06175 [Mesorhizobium sp.]|uniref:hypothetical protein n=1 Tax=Mesorhizobium sp. TaxID=1871066 RepID=UPI00122B43F2|nr:hypothetical protein [Mesorhizobium sp.]TIM31601.1 MAG: hypothetical protein E5Y63_06175 [Mesorhizobium sp.]
MANPFSLRRLAFTLLSTVILAPSVYAAEQCNWDGLCAIINESLPSINVNEYELRGLNTISASFDGELTTAYDLDVNVVSIKNADRPQENTVLSFTDMLSALGDFFKSRDSKPPAVVSGQDGNGLRLFDDKGIETAEYLLYLDYLKRFETTKAELEKAETRAARQFLADDLKAIESGWIAAGYKYEIEKLLRDAETKKGMDPTEIVKQLDSLETVIDPSVVSRSISTQLSSDAWNLIKREFPDGSAPTVTISSRPISVRQISFEVTVFPTLGRSLLPENIVKYIVDFFSSNDCAEQDAPCKRIERWLGGMGITTHVVLVRNIRLWLGDEVDQTAIKDFASIDFASETYLEMSGPFLYMTQRSGIGF